MHFLTRRLAVMFAAFVMLGMPEGVLGTAWPSIRISFERPESALAQLLISYTVGYLVSSMAAGRLTERVGSSASTRLGVTMTATGLAIYTVSPLWMLTIGAATVLGLGAGVVDTGINTEVALQHGQRAMNLLHAAFGVGATLGPLAVTALLGLDASWRIAYGALFILEVAILGALVLTRRDSSEGSNDSQETSTYGERSRRPDLTLLATLGFFAFYVGSEVSIGQWSFSILTEERGVTTTAAGLAVAAYWGGLTAGRIALGVLDQRLHPLVLLRGSMLAAVAAGIWFYSDTAGSLLALPVMGLAFSGMFPAVVLLSSSWLGTERLGRAVGYQLAASSAGAIVASAVLGFIADRIGLDAVAGAIVVLIVGLSLAHLATEQTVR